MNFPVCLRNEHSPVLSTRPFIPGQTSTVGSGGNSNFNHHPGSFGGALMTPEARNQVFTSPVIPTQPLASGDGAWGVPRRLLSGFGGGAGSTPGPRSQDLPPVIPNPTLGGGWSTPSRPPGDGMTPGPRSQDLPPVIPHGWVE